MRGSMRSQARASDADGAVAAQAATWLTAAARGEEPWCAVVSLTRPHQMDAQLGVLMAGLDSVQAVKRNTVVIFTSERGAAKESLEPQDELAGAEDAVFHTPLVVRDFSGRLQAQPGDRPQLISQVDLSALLLTIAYGGNGWRTLDECAHLAGRLDLFAMLRNPQATGRAYVLHTCDEPSAPGRWRPGT
jgi:membrane-anchored protein YejM (alkaline phosphatase superfamily)